MTTLEQKIKAVAKSGEFTALTIFEAGRYGFMASLRRPGTWACQVAYSKTSPVEALTRVLEGNYDEPKAPPPRPREQDDEDLIG